MTGIGYESHGTGALDPDRYLTDDDKYIFADCGHEVYNCEYIFDWEDGKTLCPECMESKFNELSLAEKADLLGCAWSRVML